MFLNQPPCLLCRWTPQHTGSGIDFRDELRFANGSGHMPLARPVPREMTRMPLFSYECEDCGAQCEVLVRGGESPVCPDCGSSHLSKQASGFAALSGSGTDAVPPPCAASGCCQAQGGGCPLA